MPLPTSKQQPTGSPRHQAGGQQQKGAQQHEPSIAKDRHPAHFRTSEQSKLPIATVKKKMPAAPSEEKPLPKLAEEPPKPSESPLSKGKITPSKPERDIKDGTVVSESQKTREQEVSTFSLSNVRTVDGGVRCVGRCLA